MPLLALVALAGLSLHASVVGTSSPALSLTAARVNSTLPAAQRAPWLAYIKRSEEQRALDKAALAHERQGLASLPPLPMQGNSGRALPLDRDASFYGSADARRLGEIILSFQTPAGGWSKNLAMERPRARGQSYATANLAPVPSAPGDFDEPADPAWHYVGTLDNDATNTELHFLARLSAALPGPEGNAFRAAFLRGVRYLLQAQFPNGGWPQVWPLEGGYHDAVTFNDDAVTESAELLTEAASGQPIPMSARDADPPASPTRAAIEDFTFVPPAVRAQARAAVANAIRCILAAQLRMPSPQGSGAVLAVWPQQSDPLTLAPVAARNFEPAALSAGESASIVDFLMTLPRPSPAAVRAVQAAAAWFQANEITGYAWVGGRNTPGGRHLQSDPSGGPLWPRYTSLTTGKPIFGDRDKSIHDNVMEISLERRNGYAWYTRQPAGTLARFHDWTAALLDGCMGDQLADPSLRGHTPCKPPQGDREAAPASKAQ